MRKRKYAGGSLFGALLFIILYFFGNGLADQQIPFVHFNKSFYASGEVIWYKAYLGNTFSGQKSALLVSVYNNDAQLLDAYYLLTNEEGTSNGYLKIPQDAKSGLHQFVISTFEHKNESPIPIFRAYLPIYSDFEKPKPAAAPKMTENGLNHAAFVVNELNIVPSFSTELVSTRGTLPVKLKVETLEGVPVKGAEISVSIRDQGLTEIQHPLFTTIKSNKEIKQLPVSPSDKIILQGHFSDSFGKALVKKGNIGASVVGKSWFEYFQTEADGSFYLDLDPVAGPFSVQFLSFYPKGLKATIQPHNLFEQTSTGLPQLPSVDHYLELTQERKAIFQLFGKSEYAFTTQRERDTISPLPKDASYWIDEYETFPDMATLAKELFLPLKFRKTKNETLLIKMFNADGEIRQFYKNPPLFIVDGYLTTDQTYFAGLEVDQLDTLELVWSFEKLRDFYGPLGYNGVVSVSSKNKNLRPPGPFMENVFSFSGVQVPAVYPIQLNLMDQVLLTPSLYWNPELRTDAFGEVTFEVPISDDQSTFIMEVFVMDNLDRKGVVKKTFTVSK